jgi:3alpha(or 20beta)-hydroxysteroid dehydrogenase
MGRLDGKVALVTGAARGTGAECARLFAAEGARVLLTDVLDELGALTAKELGARAAYQHLDVSSESDWQRAVDTATARFGKLDLLVNNAGLLLIKSIEELSAAECEKLWRVNQLGPFLGIRAVIPAMKAAGGGSIVNIASIDGLVGNAGLAAYGPTKWGLRGLTRIAALELGAHGIRVNAVCPEVGSPEMRAPYVPPGVDPAKILAIAHTVLPRQRRREPIELVRDVARMALFLASDESLSCTGGDYPVDAGITASAPGRKAPR